MLPNTIPNLDFDFLTSDKKSTVGSYMCSVLNITGTPVSLSVYKSFNNLVLE